MTTPLPTIFVAIASYRDPECQFTVRDLFEKAAHPERIRVGICWQYEPETDNDCFIIPSPYPEHTRMVRYMTWESKGGCWARAEALALAEGEDYIMQLDAHMRFVPGWDDILIETLARCPTPRAVLSTCPAPYLPPDRLTDMEGHLSVTITLAVHGKEGMQPLSIGGNRRPWSYIRTKGPIPVPFVTANFIFARREVFEEVPYDPYIYFRGQEATYALRLWTHGYNVYHPDKTVLFHYWESKTRRNPGEKEPDYKISHNPQAVQARERVWHILGMKLAENPASLRELERYGLGGRRSAASFWEYAGVNLNTGEIKAFAREGYWPPVPDTH